jgi:hypothetical protein
LEVLTQDVIKLLFGSEKAKGVMLSGARAIPKHGLLEAAARSGLPP